MPGQTSAYIRVSSGDQNPDRQVDLAQLVQDMTGRGVRVEFAAEHLAFDPGAEDPFALLLGAPRSGPDDSDVWTAPPRMTNVLRRRSRPLRVVRTKIITVPEADPPADTKIISGVGRRGRRSTPQDVTVTGRRPRAARTRERACLRVGSTGRRAGYRRAWAARRCR